MLRTSLIAALALALPATASAAPVTATTITSPLADPTVIVYPEPAGSTLAVTGTSNGGVNLVDIRCEGAIKPLAAAVKPAATGAWSVTLSAAAVNNFGARTCFLHAAPHKTSGANRAAFPGRRLIVQRTKAIAAIGGPNNGMPFNFNYAAPQLAGRGIYESIGGCGLREASAINADLSIAAPAFACAAFIEPVTAGRAGVYIDKQNAFLANGAANIFAGATNGTGFFALQSSMTSDPVSGATTIRETSTLMRCAPQPTVLPASAATCSSFTSAGVRVDRVIQQQADGRQAVINDVWSSTDGQRHEVDAFYQTRFAGSAPAVSFPWVGGYTVYPPSFVPPAPPAGPFSFFGRPSVSTPDGDPKSTQSAVTLQDLPTSMSFSQTSGSTLWTQYVRTIQPDAPAKVNMAFSWGSTQADVTGLANQVQAAIGTSQCVVPNVFKRKVKYARAALAAAHCSLGKITRAHTKKVRKFFIVAQGARGGVTLPAGSQIAIVVSDGPRLRKK